MKYFLIILFSLQLITVNLFAAATNTYLDQEGVMAVDENASEGDKNNQLATSLCQLILLLNGRIGRAIAVIAIFTLAILFMTSKLTVPVFLTFIIGIAMLFGAKSIALIMLPSYVKVKEADRGVVTKTPEELIKQVCPELK
jgi:type IV secretory pathway VirB2 component (pilin)